MKLSATHVFLAISFAQAQETDTRFVISHHYMRQMHKENFRFTKAVSKSFQAVDSYFKMKPRKEMSEVAITHAEVFRQYKRKELETTSCSRALTSSRAARELGIYSSIGGIDQWRRGNT